MSMVTRRHARHRRSSGGPCSVAALLPEFGRRPAPVPRPYHLALQLLAGGLTAGLVAGLFGAAWWHDMWVSEVGPQHEPAAAALRAEDLAVYRASRTPTVAGGGAAPIVLAYRDVRPGASGKRDVVSPTRFAEHLQMLEHAGYRTLSGEEFVAYLRGTFEPPPRSVLLTFDDGTESLYRYVDPLLARYGGEAVAFITSGKIGARGAYLTQWQVDRMGRSGRWSFQPHGGDLHAKVISGQRSALRAPRPATRQVVDGGAVPRLRVLRHHDARDLFDELAAMESLPVTELDPLRVDRRWLDPRGRPLPLELSPDRVEPVATPATATIRADWAPQRTSDWTGYTVTASVYRLGSDGRARGGLRVRVGTPAEVTALVSTDQVWVRVAGRTVLARRLVPSVVHRVSVTALRGSTEVTVDGVRLPPLAALPGPSSGGPGIVAARDAPGVDLPGFGGLRIRSAGPVGRDVVRLASRVG